VLEANRHAVLSRLPNDALVLDVGGGAHPLARADWVIDLMPYADRGLYGARVAADQERFSERTWVIRDICDRDPWPFADGQFDFVVCSHTLEDVRDPIWVSQEMIRVGRAGYIEVPSRLEEQSYGFQGPWVGWGHHRWLIDIENGQIDFVFKHHVIHGRESDHFDAAFHSTLRPEQRVQWLFWERTFRFRERVLTSPAAVDTYVAGFVAAHRPSRLPRVNRGVREGRKLLGRVRRRLRPG
jgi:SAM-dependent methyltransferase